MRRLTLFALILTFAFAPTGALADGDVPLEGATVTLYDGTSLTSSVLDTTVTGSDGAFTLTPPGFGGGELNNAKLVIMMPPGFGGGELTTIRGRFLLTPPGFGGGDIPDDAEPLAGATVKLWADTDGDGVLGSAGDELLGETVTDGGGGVVVVASRQSQESYVAGAVVECGDPGEGRAILAGLGGSLVATR